MHSYTKIAGLIALFSLSACGDTISDEIGPLFDLGLTDVAIGPRQVLVHAGDENGEPWAIGLDDPSTDTMDANGGAVSILRGPPDSPAWDYSLNLFSSTNSVFATRLAVVPHRSLDVVYLLGGIYAVPVNSSQQVTPSIELFDDAATDLPGGGPAIVTIHPAGAFGSSGITEVPDDPVNAITNSFGSLRGQVPLAMAPYYDAGVDTSRVVALLPFGKGVVDPLPPPVSFGPGAQASSHYHRRALAFFALNDDGTVVDACPSSAGLTTPSGSVVTTEPAWLIDLPDELLSATGATAPVRAGNIAGQSWQQFTDPRLFAVNSQMPTSPESETFMQQLLSQRFYPAPPQLLVDEEHERGYLFINRWVGDDVSDDPAQLWHDATSQNGGFAVLAGFSLAAPSGSGEPDPTACNVSATAPAYDPFDGAYASQEAVDLSYTTFAPTAGMEAVSLSELFSTNSDGSPGDWSSRPLCFLFQGGGGSDPNGTPCTTDAIPYHPVALDRDRQLVVVAETGDNAVLLFDGKDLSAAATKVAVGAEPVSVATLDGRAYVVNRASNNVSVVDLDTARVTNTISVGRAPVNLAIDRKRQAGPLIYVVDLLGDNLAVVDPSTAKVHFAPTCMRPAELYLDPFLREGVVQCKGSVSYPEDNSGSFRTAPARSQRFKLVD